jgi:hypothetical protein
MNSIIIKQFGHLGADSKGFRAWADFGSGKPQWTNISTSTTNDGESGLVYCALRCAAKAFVRFTEPKANVIEIESRIKLTRNAPGIWRADLQPQEAK